MAPGKIYRKNLAWPRVLEEEIIRLVGMLPSTTISSTLNQYTEAYRALLENKEFINDYTRITRLEQEAATGLRGSDSGTLSEERAKARRNSESPRSLAQAGSSNDSVNGDPEQSASLSKADEANATEPDFGITGEERRKQALAATELVLAARRAIRGLETPHPRATDARSRGIKFPISLDLTAQDAESLRLAVLADDIAVIKIYAYSDQAAGNKGAQLHTFAVRGCALWNPASYKEDIYILPSGHKYVIDLLYRNYVHWTDGQNVDVDGVSLYKVEVYGWVEQVSFKGDGTGDPNGFYNANKDEGRVNPATEEEPYAAPHWRDNSNPKNGTATDFSVPQGEVADIKIPVAYKEDTKLVIDKVNTVFRLKAPAPQDTGAWKVRGTLSNGMSLPAVGIAVDVNDRTKFKPAADMVSGGTTPKFTSNKIQYFGLGDSALVISWDLTEDGQIWKHIGKTDHEVFVTLVKPDNSVKRRRTVLYLACKNGGANTTAATDVWKSFSRNNEPANLMGWNETTWNYTRKLHYYKTATGGNNLTAEKLLEDTTGNEGQCFAFADLMRQTLHVHDVAHKGVFVQATTTAQPPVLAGMGFIVKSAPPKNPADPLPYTSMTMQTNKLNYAAKGLAGQNVSTPTLKVFSIHQILKVDSVYYDPSYGRTPTGAADFNTKSVEYHIYGNPTPGGETYVIEKRVDFSVLFQEF